MNKKLKFLNYIWMFFLLSCSTTPKPIKPAHEKSRPELQQETYEISSPTLPAEKLIRKDLDRFKSILGKKKSLSPEDWKLHNQLLDYYIQLKEGANTPNTVYIPARSRWAKKFESYCLDPRKASPEDNERLLWGRIQSKIPYLRELLGLPSKSKGVSQEDIQTLIWNLHNKTIWEDYPSSLQKILLSIDPQAPKKLPNQISEAIKDEVLDTVRSQFPGNSDVEGVIHLVQGKYYDYRQIRTAIENRKSKYELKPTDAVPQIPDTPLFAETKSNNFTDQKITFYNPTDQDVILDLSEYQLEPLRPDIQPLALIDRRGPYSPFLVSDLEHVLYGDMMRLGLGFTPVLNDLIDLFEASTGRDFFNDEWLSDESRFLSAMGILAGSGQYYRYAKKVLKGPTSYVRDVQKKYRRARNRESLKKMKEVVLLADEKIPRGWGKEASDPAKAKWQGFEYAHPDRDYIRIRVMPGNPNSKHLNSRKPYVRQTINKQPVDRDGNIVRKRSNEAHIPLDEYQFTEFWKKYDKRYRK